MRNPSALAVFALLLASCDLFEVQTVYLTPEEVAVLEAKHGAPTTSASREAWRKDTQALLGAQVQDVHPASGGGAMVTLVPPAQEGGTDLVGGLIDLILGNPTTSGLLATLPLAIGLILRTVRKRQALAATRGKPPGGAVAPPAPAEPPKGP
jgi:hypothetical protein